MTDEVLLEKLTNFHREFLRFLPKDQRTNYLVEAIDDVMTEATGVTFHSCPFCHDMLFESTGKIHRTDGTTKDIVVWICNSNGNHGGQSLVFIEGSKNCKNISGDGPFCNLRGFCLWQVHGPVDHPVRCKGGKIDAQSCH